MYILIIAIIWAGKPTIATAEFGDQHSCERAASSFKLAWGDATSVYSSCTPKANG